MRYSHPEGATEAMQSSLTEPMLSTTGNASSTQRLLEGQTDAATTAKALIKPDAWVQAGKTLFQRATGRLKHANDVHAVEVCMLWFSTTWWGRALLVCHEN